MTRRFSCKNVVIAIGGTTLAHGLAAIPDEWFFNLRTGPTNIDSKLYLTAAPTSTNIIVASGSGATQTGDVFCAVNHSIVK